MTEEEQYADLDLPDVVDDSEHFTDLETHIHDHTDSMVLEIEPQAGFDSEPINSEDQLSLDKKPTIQGQKVEVVRSTRLPIARIKNIMKMDPDVNVVHADAVFLVTKATELFLETMAKETFSYLPKNKKTINKKELDLVINKVDCLCFLEGAMDF